MTERILPAVAVRAPVRHAGPGVPARRTGPGVARPALRPLDGGAGSAVARPAARAGVHRSEALLSTPARAGMLFGMSAAVYAVSLAGMSALQATSDADLAAQRQPYVDAVAEMRAANDALEVTITSTGARAQALVGTYEAAGNDIGEYQARLDSLAALVADVQGSAAALPTRINLPKVTIRAATTTSRAAPRTTTKTTASGH
jgi:hypothetical protein